MGDVGDGIFQLGVALLIPMPVIYKFLQLFINGISKVSHMPVPAGKIDQHIAVRREAVRKGVGDLIC